MKPVQSLIVRVAVAGIGLAAIGCAGSAGPTTAPDAATPPAAVASSIAPSPTFAPGPSFAGQVIDIVARDRLFSVAEFEVAAGAAFEIRLNNQDPFEHAIYITKGVRENNPGDAEAGPSLFKGGYVTGPAFLTYDVAALAPGTYTFFCPPHPPMTGTIRVK